MIDEANSLETAKHVKRLLRENARRGFWNGGNTPYGYRIIGAEKRGKTSKKKLAVHEDHAAILRKMFDLSLHGDGSSGPMGIKSIVKWLNERGYRTRLGNNWSISVVHRLLSDRAYLGTFTFRSSQDGGEEIGIDVPRLIESETFDAVQQGKSAKDPKKTPPRTVTGDVLLAGLATCPHCGAAMIANTGKGGRYHYYSCSTKNR